MDKKITISGVAVFAMLSGCAPALWDKPGATQQDFAADRYGCERDARQSNYFGGGIIGAINMHDFYKECMVAHGWTEQGTAPLQGSPESEVEPTAASAPANASGPDEFSGGPVGPPHSP
jgi:hypothetical protein